jgi:MFS transporter, YNFM family, putative membrane transport protein
VKKHCPRRSAVRRPSLDSTAPARHSAALSVPPEPSRPSQHIAPGSAAFLRTNLSLFAAGFATFALLYTVQPLLPVFSARFHVSPAASSLSLSLTTATLAIFMLIASALSESFGRKPVMAASLFASALLQLVSAALPHWWELLAVRALMGVTLSGLPAVAMAYVAEEIDPRAMGLAMGLYVGGSGFGGMSGRLLAGLFADFCGWRLAVAMIAALGIACGLLFAAFLPPSRNFHRRVLALDPLLGAYRGHLADPGLPWLFAEGFLLMGGFVTIYNYIGYRLLAPPFSLSQAEVGLIFTVYLAGILGSAWMGHLAAQVGRARIFRAALMIDLAGMVLTLSHDLGFVILGVAVLTFGFFAAHSIASSWVGIRARHSRAQASALYLLLYYLGSSLVGSAGGFFWVEWRWPGVVGLTGGLIVLALLAARRLKEILTPGISES